MRGEQKTKKEGNMIKESRKQEEKKFNNTVQKRRAAQISILENLIQTGCSKNGNTLTESAIVGLKEQLTILLVK